MRFLHPILVLIVLSIGFYCRPDGPVGERYDGLFIASLVLGFFAALFPLCGDRNDLNKVLGGHPIARTLNLVASLALSATGCYLTARFGPPVYRVGHFDLLLIFVVVVPGALGVGLLVHAVRLMGGFGTRTA